MAAKKKNRGLKSPGGGKLSGITTPKSEIQASAIHRDWIIPCLYGLFLLLLVLTCSPALDSKFSLPKLIVLRTGMLGIVLFTFVCIWRGFVVSPPRAVFILALTLGIWWTATTPFAIHLPTALDGEYDYYNGLWMHLCWLALFLVSLIIPADKVTLRRIVAFLVIAIVPVAVINLSESIGLSSIGLKEVSTLGDRVGAGALMNFAIPFTGIALVRVRSWTRKIWLIGLIVLFLASEIVSQARGPWMGLVVAVFILAVGFARSKAAWMVIAGTLAAATLLASVTASLNPQVARRFATLMQVTQDESLGQRFIYYKVASRATLDHPFIGIGFENFRNIYPLYRSADPNFLNNIIPTMVHNGYLETALNNGIPALLLYAALVGVVLTSLVRRLRNEQDQDKKDLLLGFLATLAAYLVQDLTGWLDIVLASVFWISLGLAANMAGENTPRLALPVNKPFLVAFSMVGILLSLFLLHDGYTRLIADSSLFQAQSLDVRSQWRESEALANKALSSFPGDARTELIAGHIYVNRYVAVHDPLAYSRANELLQSSYRRNPFDRLRLINVMLLETAALDLRQIREPSDFAKNSIPLLAKTDSDNPGFHEATAKFLAAQGRFGEALAAIRKARQLNPQDGRYLSMEMEYQARIGR